MGDEGRQGYGEEEEKEEEEDEKEMRNPMEKRKTYCAPRRRASLGGEERALRSWIQVSYPLPHSSVGTASHIFGSLSRQGMPGKSLGIFSFLPPIIIK